MSGKNSNARSKKEKDFFILEMNIKRGDIYYADLSPVIGSEQGGLRPVLIVQNDVGNRHSPTVYPPKNRISLTI